MRGPRLVATALIGASALGACGDKTSAPKVPSAVEAVGSLTPTGVVGSVLAGPFSVRIKDSRGRGISGITASCAPETGSGSITIAAPVSKSDGTASCGAWTLGTRAGPQVLTVTVGQLTPLRFTATATASVTTQLALLVPPQSSIRSGIGLDAPVAIQARDLFSNNAAAPGIVITILVNSATVTGGSATTDGSGRAVFTALRINGVAGPRTMLFTTALTALTVPPPASFGLAAGAGTQLAVVQGLPANVQVGAIIAPSPRVQVRDADGNNAPESGVVITASVVGANVTGGTVATDATGAAAFPALTIVGGGGAYALTFAAAVLQPSPAVPFQLIEASATPASVEFGVGDAKVMIVDPGQTVTMPAIVLRNNVATVLPAAQASVTVRSPALGTISVDGRLTAGESGRTAVVANSVDIPALADSIVVHVTRGPGPLLRTDLTSLALTVGTQIDVRVFFDARTTGALSAVTVDVAYPRQSPSLMSVPVVTPTANTTAVASQTAGLVRLVYVNSTGQAGLVELARLRFTITNGSPNFSQIVLTPLQVVSAALQDLTNVTTSINPIFAVRQ
jgi:hypothetical protein